jgi:hypothetical protein
LEPFIYKNDHFAKQDRLGTNIGKTQKKCRFPHLRRPRAEILHEVVNIVGCQGHCQLQRQLPRRIHKREERAGWRPEDQESVSIPEKAVSVFECFPCVYSEPVLVKRISF